MSSPETSAEQERMKAIQASGQELVERGTISAAELNHVIKTARRKEIGTALQQYDHRKHELEHFTTHRG